MSFQKVSLSLGRALWNNGYAGRTALASSTQYKEFSNKCDDKIKSPTGQCKDKGCGSVTQTTNQGPLSSSAPSLPQKQHEVGKKRQSDGRYGGPAGCYGGPAGRTYPRTAGKADQKAHLWARYNDTKRLVHGE